MWQLAAVPFFAYAGWQDLQTRRVSKWIWWPLAIAGLYPVWKQPVAAAVGIGVTAAIVGALHVYGQFGMADVKASLVLAMLFPTYPDVLFQPTPGVFSISVLLNATIVSVVVWILTRDDAMLNEAPFVMFMFVGLLISLSVGDLATAAIQMALFRG